VTAIRSGIVRTVLGDVEASALGVTYAHEHLVIDGGRPVELFPDFQLGDVDRIVTEVRAARAAGLEAAVDAMPCDAGRNVLKLAAIARRTGLKVIAPTGLHHERYYRPGHWSERASADELGQLFAADVVDGIDERDYGGPLVRRTEHRAGVVKIAGSRDGPSARDQRVFEGAAVAHRGTGVPILTHCEEGTGAAEQFRFLVDRGVGAPSIVLSHVDKVVDRGYHREILAAGAFVEYDQSFRWKQGESNGTLRLLEWMLEDGFGEQIVLGMDAARQRYLRAFGGAPGLTWLLDGFSAMMAERGIGEPERRRFFVDNPARAFAFQS
jgi:predicted metal-dependent phosphotriesterase family hydrolase